MTEGKDKTLQEKIRNFSATENEIRHSRCVLIESLPPIGTNNTPKDIIFEISSGVGHVVRGLLTHGCACNIHLSHYMQGAKSKFPGQSDTHGP